MQIQNRYTVTEWLSLDQLRELLQSGSLKIEAGDGTLHLLVNFIDRVSAQELVKE